MIKLENRLRVIKGAFLTFLFLLNFFSVAIYAQEKRHKVSESKVSTFAEKMPEYTGGEDAMSNFIIDNIKYPKEYPKGGKVYITFVVTKTGKVTQARVLKGFDDYFDKECLRVVNMMPDWKPGKQKGKKINVQFVLPINIEI